MQQVEYNEAIRELRMFDFERFPALSFHVAQVMEVEGSVLIYSLILSAKTKGFEMAILALDFEISI